MSSDQILETPVIIETARYRIIGYVAVPDRQRLSDYANDHDRHFFAVTRARVAPLDSPEQQRRVEFILVARHEVGILTPGVEELEDTHNPMAIWDE